MMVPRIAQIACLLVGGLCLGCFADSHPLPPILFSPPPHYQVLRKLGQRGELAGPSRFYALDLPSGLARGWFPMQNSSQNRSVLKHWLEVAGKLGANALLLRPLCSSSWFCRRAAGRLAFERYSAEAIRVAGSPCLIPLRCWSVQEIITGSQQLRRARHESEVHIFPFRRPFGLSIAVGSFTRVTPKNWSGTLVSTVQGDLLCPVRPIQSYSFNPSFPILPTFASAMVGTDGQVLTTQLAIFRIGGVMQADRMMARFLRHWHFQGTGTYFPPVHLLMDWHLIPLRKGQPLPPGVICEYPGYPASGSYRGKMVHHLRWPVYVLREGGEKELFAANPVQAR